MKCLSLKQPWASLVVHGEKKIETRSWATTYSGPLLIHASKAFPEELARLCRAEHFRQALSGRETVTSMPRGAILGIVTLVRCEPTEELLSLLGADGNEREIAFGDYSARRFGFLLRDPRPFAVPIPFRGCLGLFDVPNELIPSDLRGQDGV